MAFVKVLGSRIDAVEKGVDGRPGLNGRNGVDGRPGLNGRDGVDGRHGLPGLPGLPGINGRNGTNGINGKRGARGLRGLQGIPGTPGAPGKNGLPGRNGFPGLRGLPGVNGINGKDGKDLVPDAAMRQQLNRIESTVNNNGGKINNNGKKISDGFGDVKDRFKKLSKRLKLPELVNALTLIVTLHNAAMLSKNLLSTLGDIASTGLSLIGLKDEDGSPHDVNEIIGQSVTSFLEGILGKSVWQGLVEKWNLANTALTTGANIIYSVRGIMDSVGAITEMSAERIGVVGNALKKYRVISENAFPNMSEQVNGQSAIMNRLQNLDDAAGALGSVLGEVTNIATEVNELNEQRKKFKEDIEALEPDPEPANKPITDERNQAIANSKASPELTTASLAEGEEDGST
ncbi:MAG: collagen-like protein [Symploca sp. SIO3E6]|nr:collagen-like protein [Caldora sp. SIO3E6]